jgi:hypothetical protein
MHLVCELLWTPENSKEMVGTDLEQESQQLDCLALNLLLFALLSDQLQ